MRLDVEYERNLKGSKAGATCYRVPSSWRLKIPSLSQLELLLRVGRRRDLLALRAGADVGRIGNNHVSTARTDQVAFNRGHHLEVQSLDAVWTTLLLHRSLNSILLAQNNADCLLSIGSDAQHRNDPFVPRLSIASNCSPFDAAQRANRRPS